MTHGNLRGRSPGGVEAGHFNNDKFIDLAIASETDSSVTIFLGNGKGNFTEAAGSPFFAGPQPNDLALKDFNNDGNVDLAFANADGKADIAVCNQVDNDISIIISK